MGKYEVLKRASRVVGLFLLLVVMIMDWFKLVVGASVYKAMLSISTFLRPTWKLLMNSLTSTAKLCRAISKVGRRWRKMHFISNLAVVFSKVYN